MYHTSRFYGEIVSGVGFDDAQGDLPFGNAAVHGLLFDVVVGGSRRHFQLLDQDPFRPVDQADLLHFFFDGGGLLLQPPQAFPGGGHPFQSLLQGLERRRLRQGEDALGRDLGIDLLVNVRADQQQNHRSRFSAGVDGKPGAEIVRQGRIDDDIVEVSGQQLPPGGGDVAGKIDWVKVRTGEHGGQTFIEFLR